MQNCSATRAAIASTTALPIRASIATVDPTGGSIGRDRRNASSPAPNPAISAPTRLEARASVTALVARKGSMRMPRRTLERTGHATPSDAAAIRSSRTGRSKEGVKVVRPIAVRRWSSRKPAPAARRARTTRSPTDVRFIALPARGGRSRGRRRARAPGARRPRRGRARAPARTAVRPRGGGAAAAARRRRSRLRTR